MCQQNRPILLFFSFFLFTNYGLFGQGKIEGVVMQSDSIQSLAEVSVVLENTKMGTATDAKGHFTMKVPAGDYVLAASCLGYIKQKKNIRVTDNETLSVKFYLQEYISVLPELEVMTKGYNSLKGVPGAVQYLSQKELQKYNYTDFNRMARLVPGINVQEEDGFGLRPNIGMRGTGVDRSSKITLMEDGVLTAPAPYVEPSAYYFPTVGRMYGIEILKGSSQIQYGPYTTGGAINFISTPIPSSFSGRISLFGGSFGAHNLHVHVGDSYKNFGYLVESFHYGSDGFKKIDNGGNSGFDKKDYLIKFRVNTNPDAKVYQSLTFKIAQVDGSANETYLGLTQADFDATPYRRYAASRLDNITDRQRQYSITHVAKFSPSLQLTTMAYRSDFRRLWYKLEDMAIGTTPKKKIREVLENPEANPAAYNALTGNTTGGDTLFLAANNRQYYLQGIQSNLSYHLKKGEFSHEVLLGLRIHRDQADRFQWTDDFEMRNSTLYLITKGEPGTGANRVAGATALATFLKYKWQYKKLILTPGLRLENITSRNKDYGKKDTQRTGKELTEKSNSVNVWIPGMGINYNFNQSLSAFGGVHRGFSPPGYQTNAKPEKSINYELGGRYLRKTLTIEVTGFYTDYSNMLGADLSASGGTGSGQLYNSGKVMSQGLEFQLNYQLPYQLFSSVFIPVGISYTYTDAHFLDSFKSEFKEWGKVNKGDLLPYLAHNQLTISAGFEHRLFNLNLNAHYMDAMRTTPGQGFPKEFSTDPYWVLDVAANYKLHQYVDLFSSVTNATNEVYNVARRPTGLRPGMPRTFTFGVKVNF